LYDLRIQKLRAKMEDKGIEGVVISKQENRYYISGFTGSDGLAIITKNKAIIVTDSRYVEQAKAQAPDYEISLNKGRFSPLENALSILESFKINNVGIEGNTITVNEFDQIKSRFPNMEFVKTRGLVEGIRIIKDAHEIETIRAAQNITDKAFTHIMDLIKPGAVERDLAVELEYFMKKSGAEDTAFDTIFASGPRSSLPHGAPTDRKLQMGDFITIDFGAKFGSYCSDMTRTVVIGKPSKEQLKIYNTVLLAQEKAIDYIKPGILGKDLDKIARDIISSEGFGDCFGHGLGHGVGVEIHEEPRISPLGDTLLQPGMVITVEPGIYIEGFCGVRIEDMLVVTENGCENFTKSKKQMICL